MTCKIITATTVLVCLICGTSVADEVSTTQIAHQWRLRQKAVDTLILEWKRTTFIPKGAQTEEQRALHGRLAEEAKLARKSPPVMDNDPVPPQDESISSVSRLVVDQARIRYAYSAPEWSLQNKQFKVKQYASVFVDEKSTSLHFDGSSLTDFPDALVQVAKRHPNAFEPPLRAPMTVFFGNDSSRQPWPLDNFIVKRTFVENNTRIAELTRHLPGEYVDTLWLNVDRGFVPARIRSTQNGRPLLEISIEVIEHPVCGWVPSRWIVKNFFRDGSLSQSLTCVTTKVSINESIEPKEFEIAFPPGTLVNDQGSGSRRGFIVEKDGKQRQLSKAEETMSYSEIIATGQRIPQYQRWIFGGLVLVAIAGIIAIVVTRRKRTANHR